TAPGCTPRAPAPREKHRRAEFAGAAQSYHRFPNTPVLPLPNGGLPDLNLGAALRAPGSVFQAPRHDSQVAPSPTAPKYAETARCPRLALAGARRATPEAKSSASKTPPTTANRTRQPPAVGSRDRSGGKSEPGSSEPYSGVAC